MPSKTNVLACGAIATGAVWSAQSFIAPGTVQAPQYAAETATAAAFAEEPIASRASTTNSQASGWSAVASVGAALGVMGAASLSRGRTGAKAEAKPDMSSRQVAIPVGKAGFVGATNDAITVITRCPKTGRAREQQVRAATAMAAGSSTKTAINGFGRIGRNVLRCWLKREEKPFDIVAINVGSMGAKTAAHLLKYDTVLGTLQADVSFTDDAITVDGKEFKVVSGRDPAAMPWKDLDVEVIIESTGAFNSLEGGSKHLDAGAKKVVLTAPGKNCPTYVVGVNEGDYDPENDVVVSNASCTTNGMASVCKVLGGSFGGEEALRRSVELHVEDSEESRGKYSGDSEGDNSEDLDDGPASEDRGGGGVSMVTFTKQQFKNLKKRYRALIHKGEDERAGNLLAGFLERHAISAA